MKKRIRISAVAAMAVGFFCGAVIPELFRMNQGSYSGLLGAYGLQKFSQMNVKAMDLFYYVLPGRMACFSFLWMSCYTPAGLMIHLFYLFWLCLSLGILLSLFLLRQGGQGILTLFACILPQWLVYLTVLRWEFAFFEMKQISVREIRTGNGKRELQVLGKILLSCFIGCILETWFGLFFFQMYLRYL